MAGFEHAARGPHRPAAPWGVRVGARVRRAANKLASVGLAGVLLWLGGCASLPSQVQRTPSSAIADVAATPLAQLAAASTPAEHARLSGLRLLPDAAPAFELRLALARMAQASLDVQYYLIAQDDSGGQLLAALEQAARRGVRVRLLVDDLYTAHTDAMLRALADHPNVEVRLFNPFCCLRGSTLGRFAGSLGDLYRVNHRMHNKLLIADGLFAVAGGRNIGDEYFMLDMSSNFVDMDSLVAGALIAQLQHIFDQYWNSEVVYPVQAIVAAAVPAAQAMAEFERLSPVEHAPPELPPVDALGYGPLTAEALAPGLCSTVSCSAPLSQSGSHTVQIIADDNGMGTGQTSECNETNNTGTMSFAC